jgi:hypothetical protein
MQEQDGQERAWLAGRELEHASLPARLERPEDAELERFAHTDDVRNSRRSTGVNRSSTADGDAAPQIKTLEEKETSCSLRLDM